MKNQKRCVLLPPSSGLINKDSMFLYNGIWRHICSYKIQKYVLFYYKTQKESST